MDPKPDDPVLPFADSAAFERWLAKHHGTAAVVWIKFAKKGTGEPSITWTEAVDVALCYGRWAAAYDSPRTAVVPDDLARALEGRPKAKAAFAKLDATNRYSILHRLQNAKQPQTRARRIETFVAKLDASKTRR